MKGDPAKIIGQFEALVARAIGRTELPDLIVWPETSYPFGYIAIDSRVDRATLEKQVQSVTAEITAEKWIDLKTDIAEDLRQRAERAKVPMLIGSIVYDHRADGLQKYNAAILVLPGLADVSTSQIYRKMHLVPFGEYVPLIDMMPWLSALTPYERHKVPRLSFGRAPVEMTLGKYRLAVTICFEDTVPQVIAAFFREPAGSPQPDVLINLSNDGWFHGSAELDMHLAIGVFRAIEHRVPLARAVNTGLTALVDGNGEVRAYLPKDSDGVLSITVPLDDRGSFYSRTGDWLGLSCLAVTIGLVPLGIVRKRRRRRP